MFNRTCSRTARSMLTCIRELFLILAVGVLGSQLLLTLNGGMPIGVEAQAGPHSHLQAQFQALISSATFDLEPGTPTALRSVYLNVEFLGGVEPEVIMLSATPHSPDSYPCYPEGDSSWHCLTPGLKIVELEQIVISSS